MTNTNPTATPRPVKLDPHRPLVDLLTDRGLRHRKPLGSYPRRNQWAREVVDQSGVVVFVGDCFEVVEWLRDGMPTQAHTRHAGTV